MTSHELAKQLLEMPDIKVLANWPQVVEIVDIEHSDFKECPEDVWPTENPKDDDPYKIWWNSQPKIQVISLEEDE